VTAHTPGPWRVEDIGTNCLFIKGGVHIEASATPSQREYYSNLATVTQRDPHPHLDGGIPRDVTAANARLIAAAPELLEALQTTLGNIMSLGPAGALESVPMPYRVWADVCSKAIDKATKPKPRTALDKIEAENEALGLDRCPSTGDMFGEKQ
jgi:hypothetical protein